MRRATPRKQCSGSEVAAWGHTPHHGAGQLDWLSRWLFYRARSWQPEGHVSGHDMWHNPISVHHQIGRVHHADYDAPCFHRQSIGMARGVCVLGGALEVRSYKWRPISCMRMHRCIRIDKHLPWRPSPNTAEPNRRDFFYFLSFSFYFPFTFLLHSFYFFYFFIFYELVILLFRFEVYPQLGTEAASHPLIHLGELQPTHSTGFGDLVRSFGPSETLPSSRRHGVLSKSQADTNRQPRRGRICTSPSLRCPSTPAPPLLMLCYAMQRASMVYRKASKETNIDGPAQRLVIGNQQCVSPGGFRSDPLRFVWRVPFDVLLLGLAVDGEYGSARTGICISPLRLVPLCL